MNLSRLVVIVSLVLLLVVAPALAVGFGVSLPELGADNAIAGILWAGDCGSNPLGGNCVDGILWAG